MKLHVMCAVAQWFLVAGNSLDSCIVGNGKYLERENDVDVSQLTGNWYTQYVIPKNLTDLLTCWISTLEIKPDGRVDLMYSYYNQSTQERQSSVATFKYTKNAFRLFDPDDVKFNGLYHILATDYEHFTLNGGCPDRWDGVNMVMWIDFRSKDPTKTALDAAKNAVEQQGLEMSDFGDVCPDHSQYF